MMSEEDRQAEAVRAYVLDTFALWGDAEGYASRFSEASEYVAFDGSIHRGRRANADLHRALFDGVLFGTRIVGEVESVRFVTPDVAVAHAVGGVVWPWHRTVPARRRSRQTLVVARTPAGLTITAFHNTRVAPLGTPPAWVSRLWRAFTIRRAGLARAA
ncbi:MAG TPA: SgcJ/EcaC family oxidoreductase [Polyangiaceae bacterium]|nr:SgcJ/EcaC family oxidoreductase [Polyangiaceae bacterium]